MDAFEKRLDDEIRIEQEYPKQAPASLKKARKWWWDFKSDHPVLAVLINIFGK